MRLRRPSIFDRLTAVMVHEVLAAASGESTLGFAILNSRWRGILHASLAVDLGRFVSSKLTDTDLPNPKFPNTHNSLIAVGDRRISLAFKTKSSYSGLYKDTNHKQELSETPFQPLLCQSIHCMNVQSRAYWFFFMLRTRKHKLSESWKVLAAKWMFS